MVHGHSKTVVARSFRLDPPHRDHFSQRKVVPSALLSASSVLLTGAGRKHTARHSRHIFIAMLNSPLAERETASFQNEVPRNGYKQGPLELSCDSNPLKRTFDIYQGR